MRYRLRTLVAMTAIGPPLLALAWFTLPLLYVQFIAVCMIAAFGAFAMRWRKLASEATEMESNQLRAELNQQGPTDNRP